MVTPVALLPTALLGYALLFCIIACAHVCIQLKLLAEKLSWANKKHAMANSTMQLIVARLPP